MIELQQLQNYLIGTQTSVLSLAKKDHARLLVASDSHGNSRILKKIIEQYGPSTDAFIFCGDGISDLAEILETAAEQDDYKSKIPSVIAFVKGNGDPSTYPVSFDIGKYNPNSKQFLKGTILVPEKQILTVNGTNFYISHGHLDSVYFGKELLLAHTQNFDCNAAIYGHTHISFEEEINTIKMINPGSCSRPRDGKKPGFAIITVEKSFIDTAFIKIQNSFSDNPSFCIE